MIIKDYNEGENIISKSISKTNGQRITMIATANKGFEFDHWGDMNEGTPGYSNERREYVVTSKNDTTITALFKKKDLGKITALQSTKYIIEGDAIKVNPPSNDEAYEVEILFDTDKDWIKSVEIEGLNEDEFTIKMERHKIIIRVLESAVRRIGNLILRIIDRFDRILTCTFKNRSLRTYILSSDDGVVFDSNEVEEGRSTKVKVKKDIYRNFQGFVIGDQPASKENVREEGDYYVMDYTPTQSIKINHSYIDWSVRYVRPDGRTIESESGVINFEKEFILVGDLTGINDESSIRYSHISGREAFKEIYKGVYNLDHSIYLGHSLETFKPKVTRDSLLLVNTYDYVLLPKLLSEDISLKTYTRRVGERDYNSINVIPVNVRESSDNISNYTLCNSTVSNNSGMNFVVTLNDYDDDNNIILFDRLDHITIMNKLDSNMSFDTVSELIMSIDTNARGKEVLVDGTSLNEQSLILESGTKIESIVSSKRNITPLKNLYITKTASKELDNDFGVEKAVFNDKLAIVFKHGKTSSTNSDADRNNTSSKMMRAFLNETNDKSSSILGVYFNEYVPEPFGENESHSVADYKYIKVKKDEKLKYKFLKEVHGNDTYEWQDYPLNPIKVYESLNNIKSEIERDYTSKHNQAITHNHTLLDISPEDEYYYWILDTSSRGERSTPYFAGEFNGRGSESAEFNRHDRSPVIGIFSKDDRKIDAYLVTPSERIHLNTHNGDILLTDNVYSIEHTPISSTNTYIKSDYVNIVGNDYTPTNKAYFIFDLTNVRQDVVDELKRNINNELELEKTLYGKMGAYRVAYYGVLGTSTYSNKVEIPDTGKTYFIYETSAVSMIEFDKNQIVFGVPYPGGSLTSADIVESQQTPFHNGVFSMEEGSKDYIVMVGVDPIIEVIKTSSYNNSTYSSDGRFPVAYIKAKDRYIFNGITTYSNRKSLQPYTGQEFEKKYDVAYLIVGDDSNSGSVKKYIIESSRNFGGGSDFSGWNHDRESISDGERDDSLVSDPSDRTRIGGGRHRLP